MAIHSSVLDWQMPWTEEPSRRQSMGLQRDGHDLATEHYKTTAQYASKRKTSKTEVTPKWRSMRR